MNTLRAYRREICEAVPADRRASFVSGSLFTLAEHRSAVAVLDVDAFWLRVDRSGPTPSHCRELGPCWTWTSRRTKKSQPLGGEPGYGELRIAGKKRYAHRIAWELSNGPIPNGLFVLHRCDYRPCCNPAHLRLGTNFENVRDMHAKGRHARGERMGSSKLTPVDIQSIRARIDIGVATQSELAREFKVSPVTVHAIVHGRTWKHVA
jgi:hypothetical protein